VFAKLSVTGYGHSPEQPGAKIFVMVPSQGRMDLKCIHVCVHPQSSHSGLCTGASARILLLQRASSYCRSLRLSWEMSHISRWDGHGQCGAGHGRADPPTKTLSHVSRVLAVHRQYHLHHLYLALTMPNLPMLTSCVLTSCAVKEHDPLDYILLPLPKMSSFMIGVTALL